MRILVQNKQRRHKIDLLKMETMANKLALAVFDNLRKDKPKANWMPYLEAIERSAALSLIIVSPQSIKKLNAQWLHKNKETDVLSFPLLDLTSTTEISNELTYFNSSNHTETNEQAGREAIEFGEIFISYEQAIKQAKEYNHSLDRELAFLFVHGLLHIFGFDHQDGKGEKEMFGRQHVILNKTGYFR
jgi:probable rRNA maturation factor